MEPPICYVCDLDFRDTEFRDDAESGGLVSFQPAPDQRELPEGWVGHPEHLGWFCKAHWSAAHELRSLTRSAALARLRGGSE